MPETTEVKQAVEHLQRAWREFKSELEAREGADSGKLDRLNGELDRLSHRLGRIDTALRRPGTGLGEDERSWRKTEAGIGFSTFLRKGEKFMSTDEVKALSVSNDTTGGYLAPSEFVREIIKGETEFSPVRTVARVRQTSNRAIQVPKRTGQFAAQWTAETGTRSETTGLTYGMEEIPTEELYALVDISQQDLEDPEFDMEAELNAEFAEQFGVAEGTAFVTGDAVGKPEGILTNSDLAETSSGDASLLTADGLIDLFHAIKSAYSRNATWMLNRTTLGAIRKLKDSQNQYLWQPGLAGLRPNTILDAPYVETPDMPDVAANANPIVFGDFRRGYLIVDRVTMSVLRDPFTQATSGNVRFIARRRVGGQVVLAEAIRKQKVAA